MGERPPKVYHVATTLNWFRDTPSESFSGITVIQNARVLGADVNFAQLLATSFRFLSRPITFTQRARGGYGHVFNATVPDFPGYSGFVVKLQKSTPDAVRGLAAAETLKDCEIANFKVFEVMYKVTNSAGETRDENYLVTFMEKLDADCSRLVLANDAELTQFTAFLSKLLQCLLKNKMTFTDMKPQNIGYRRNQFGNLQFRLLDLDGTDQFVGTYPMTAHWSDRRFPTNTKGFNAKQQQTIYAVAVTWLLIYANVTEERENIRKLLKYKSFKKFKKFEKITEYDSWDSQSPESWDSQSPEYPVETVPNPEYLDPGQREKALGQIRGRNWDETFTSLVQRVMNFLREAETLRLRTSLREYN